MKNYYFKIKALLIVVLIGGIIPINDALAQTTDIYAASGSWVCPAGVTSATIECWGGGGAGGGTTANGSRGGGGGAGGSYSKKVVTVTSSTSYTVTIGAGATGATTLGAYGGDSWFNTTGTVIAKGGAGGAAPNGGVAAGGAGSITGCIGDVVYAGGNGANGSATQSGGGGGGAGDSGTGGNASGTTGGTGTASNGGNGANGFAAESNGATGAIYGGGGSGAAIPDNTNHAGGSGADGYMTITYSVGAPAGDGKTCATAVVVSSFPFTDANQTNCGADDIYDEASPGAGGSSYLKGEEFVYMYTASVNCNIGVSLTSVSENYIGVIVSNDCFDVGTNVAKITNSGYSASGTFSVTAGNTYYIAVSTWTAPDCITDYTLTLTSADCITLSCGSAPNALNETNITATSADLGWTETDSGNQWDIEWNTTNSFSGTPTIQDTPNNPYTLSGLNPSTTYYYKVSSDCGGTNSVWSATGTFTTLACLSPSALSEIPSSTTCDLSWNANGATAWDIEVRTGALTGNPTVSGTTNNPHTVTGLSANTFYNYQVRAVCGISSSGWVTGSFTTIGCANPSVLSASNVTGSTAQINWTENGGATTWDIEYNTTGTFTGTPTVNNTTTNPHTISSLSPGTKYYFQVRADCGGTPSNWINGGSFTTPMNMGSGFSMITACGVTFYDDGGSGSDYTDNFSGITLLQPVNAGDRVVLDFTTFYTESSDKMTIYDGPDDTYPKLLDAYGGNGIPPGDPFKSTHSSGQMMLVFESDGSVNYTGWVADITCELIPPMAFVSCTTTQNNTSNTTVGYAFQEVIGIEVEITGVSSSFNATGFKVRTAGSTSPLNDIIATSNNVRVYSTGTSSIFATDNEFGNSIVKGTAVDMDIAGNQALENGTNYFWLTYDVDCDASTSNVIDASCLIVSMDGAGGNQTPTVTAPAGNRTIVASAASSTLTIGTANDMPVDGLPLELGTYNSYSQTIYDQSEIGSAGSITKIRYYYDGYSSYTKNTVEVFMGHTSESTFSDWIPGTSITQVYTGTYTVNNSLGWYEITLATPFSYNGIDNLVVAVKSDDDTDGNSAADFYMTDCTGNKSIFASNNTWGDNIGPTTMPGGILKSYRPNTQFDITWAPVMSVTNVTTSQYTSGTARDATEQRIIAVEVTTTGENNPVSAVQFQVNMNGSDAGTSDVSNIQMFYTGTSSAFSIANQFGADATPAAGTINISGSQELVEGANYFWLAYDIAGNATIGNVVDAECTSAIFSGCTGSQVPSITAPAGNRAIADTASTFSVVIGDNVAGISYFGRAIVYDSSDDSYVVAGYASDATNVPTAGDSDFLVAKVASNATLTWTTAIGYAGQDKCFDIVKTSDGGFALVGDRETSSGSGSYDVMVSKLDASGNHQWTKIIDAGSTSDAALAVIENAANELVVVGTGNYVASQVMYLWKLNLSNGNIIAEKYITQTREARDVIQTSDGGYALVGLYGLSDFCVIKLSSTLAFEGEMEWGGGTQNDYLEQIIENSANDYTVFGTTYTTDWSMGNADMYAMRFSWNPLAKAASTVTVAWAKTYGTKATDQTQSAITSVDGDGYIMAGLTRGLGSGAVGGDEELYTVKITGDGNLSWGRVVASGAFDDAGYGIIKDGIGSYIVAGLTNRPESHYYLVRLHDEVGYCCGNVDEGGVQNNLNAPSINTSRGRGIYNASTTMTSPAPTVGSSTKLTVLCETTLPVELVSFTARCEEENIFLEWTTASEINNDYFIIETSDDGINWNAINIINGAGNSNTLIDYEYSDYGVINEVRFYRLKQVDFDGKDEYSDIIAVDCANNKLNEIENIDLYPNPAKDRLILSFKIIGKSRLGIVMVNCLGLQVLDKSIEVEAGININETDISSLNNGVYIVKIIDNDSRILSTERLIINGK